MQLKEALGYAAYITFLTFLPNAVNVVTLFVGESMQEVTAGQWWPGASFPQMYGHHCCETLGLEGNMCAGGNLVLDDRMSPGSLVSFMLYVTSLNGALQVDLKHPWTVVQSELPIFSANV